MKFIFRVRIQPGHTAEEYAAAWVKASEIIQRSGGALGTRLHRRIGKPDELLAIASWDSKASRDAAPHDARVTAILKEAGKYVDIELIGEFEEPEWVVLPQKDKE
jgi:quinol monooxygenase YgiN